MAASASSLSLRWSPPAPPQYPNRGNILDYEVKYYEKVRWDAGGTPTLQWREDLELQYMGFHPQDLEKPIIMFLKTPGNEAKLVGLRAGTVYTVQVRARTEAGYGAFSGDRVFQTLPLGKLEGSCALLIMSS